MASAYFLGSSPSRPTRQDASLVVSSSPDFPSLREILSRPPKKSQLRSGSAAAPIPVDVTKTFTTATSVWRAAQRAETIATEHEQPSQSKEGPPILDISAETTTKARRAHRPKAAVPAKLPLATPETIDSERTSPSQANQPWRIFKSPIRNSESIDDETVEDLVSETKDQAQPANSSSEEAPKFAPAKEAQPVRKRGRPALKIDNEPLRIEKAPARRREEWTPPPSNQVVIVGSNSSDVKEAISSSPSKVASRQEIFDNLLESFGCKEGPTDVSFSADQERSDLSVFEKRKAIDVVATNGNLPAAIQARKSPARGKAARKKPLTITELATAAYAPPPVEEPPMPSLLPYLQHDDGQPLLVNLQDAKPKGKAKRGTKTSKKKAGNTEHLLLLSPNAAMQQAARQDYVFGTSSQLVREKSPTMLREIQQAIRASERATELSDPFASPISSGAIEPERRPPLWKAAARDEDGRLLNVEVIDLVDSPNVSHLNHETDPFGYFAGSRKDTVDTTDVDIVPSDDSFLDLSTLMQTQRIRAGEIQQANAQPPSTQPSCTQQTKPKTKPTSKIPGKPMASALLAAGESTVATKPQVDTPPIAKLAPGATDIEAIPRPKYDLFTDSQLAGEVARYGFKPVRRRNAMIALLTQCWESRNQVALGKGTVIATISTAATARDVEAPVEQLPPPKRSRGRPKKTTVTEESDTTEQMAPPAKRPRGRPRKDVASSASAKPSAKSRAKSLAIASTAPAKAAVIAAAVAVPRPRPSGKVVVEIPDSDPAHESLSPSPISSPERTFSSPPPADVSLSVEEDTELSLAMSPTTQQSAAFIHITKAVTTAPRSKEPANPSWHEKMLLYDPIVLEDLAAWLNSGQLTRVGYDAEVSPFEVKKWCESKSVCCLWRVNLSGKERKRF